MQPHRPYTRSFTEWQAVPVNAFAGPIYRNEKYVTRKIVDQTKGTLGDERNSGERTHAANKKQQTPN